MFLPIGDTPNPRGVPVINIMLITVNIAIFLLITLPLSGSRPAANDPLLLEYLRLIGSYAPHTINEALNQLSAYDLFVFRHGFRPVEPSVTSLFSAMFLHGGWMHLGGNMLFLWIFGDNLEHRLGHIGYLFTYLLTGAAATIFYALFVIDSPTPLIGASGAISGVLGAYYLWFPRNKVKTFVFLFPLIMTTLLIPARFVLGFYLVVDNLLPFLWNGGGGSGVAHGAHIGGFVAGFGLAWGIDRRKDFIRHRAEATPAEEPPPPESPLKADREEIARQVAQGNLRWATGLYFSLNSRVERIAIDAQDVLTIGNYCLNQADINPALSIFRRFIAERPNSSELDRAYLGAGKAMTFKPRCTSAAYQYFLNVLDCTNDTATADEARAHLKEIEAFRGDTNPR